jgi:hypothetical protein
MRGSRSCTAKTSPMPSTCRGCPLLTLHGRCGYCGYRHDPRPPSKCPAGHADGLWPELGDRAPRKNGRKDHHGQ